MLQNKYSGFNATKVYIKDVVAFSINAVNYD